MRIVVLNKKIILFAVSLPILLLLILFVYSKFKSTHTFNDPGNRVIVIDAGHGGIDGGASSEDLLEKNINLDIAKRLKDNLRIRGYKLILTREEDKSLDKLSNVSASRHIKDLNARTDLINSSNAQIFLSIHVNYHIKNSNANGAIVFLNDKYTQNSILANCIQKALNKIEFEGKAQTPHEPQKGNYFILAHSNLPGVIIETAFLSSESDREKLRKEEFKEALAWAIADGVDSYIDNYTRLAGN